MQINITKWLFLLILKPFARMPQGIRFAFSTFLSTILIYVYKYRENVIKENIKRVFPEATENRVNEIKNRFYRQFADNIVSQTWLFVATEKEIRKKTRFRNPEVLDKHVNQGKPIIILGAHHNNYELIVPAMPLDTKMPIAVVYNELTNKYFEEEIKKTRGQFGMHLWKKSELRAIANDWFEKGKSFALGIATDQSPHPGTSKYWMPFFGKMTAFSKGLEIYARQFDCPVYFIKTYTVARGKYECEAILVTDKPNQEPDGGILYKQAQITEQAIREYPYSWLWSHRRWKLDFERDLKERDIVYNPV